MFRVRLGLFLAFCWCMIALAQDQRVNAAKVYTAIRAGDLNAIKALLSEGISPNVADGRDVTPLMNAAAVGSLEEMKLLIEAGADVNARNSAGSTALMWAAHDPARVRLLLEHHAEVNLATKNGWTPLMVATLLHPSHEVVRLLLDRKANAEPTDRLVGFSALIGALTGTDAESQTAIFGALGTVNPSVKFQGVYTPLMLAAQSGTVSGVKRLLARGANVNEATPEGDPALRTKIGRTMDGGRTPLLLAATYGPPALVKELLDVGANVNTKDVRGMTPLMLSVTTDRPRPAITRMLLDHGADPKIKSEMGETALDWALKFGRADLTKMLGGRPTEIKAVSMNSPLPDIKSAAARSIGLLERSGKEFTSKAGCFACHAQAPVLIAQAAALSKGMAVDERIRQQFTNLAMPRSPVLPEVVMERQSSPPRGANDVALYTFESLARQDYAANRITDFYAAEIAAEQWEDGGWHGAGGAARTPLEDGDFSRTAMAMRVLKTYGTPARATEFKARMQRGKQWLMKEAPVITEDWIMRLKGVALAGASSAEIRAVAQEVLKLQRADGGWSQRAELSSDAYATGLALSVLAETGAVQTVSEAYQKGVKFLLGSQAGDGSWHVVSRAAPLQPYFESGFPYGRDQFISMTGTAWAVNALLLATDPFSKDAQK